MKNRGYIKWQSRYKDISNAWLSKTCIRCQPTIEWAAWNGEILEALARTPSRASDLREQAKAEAGRVVSKETQGPRGAERPSVTG